MKKTIGLVAFTAVLASAQPRPADKKPAHNRAFQAQASSTMSFNGGAEGDEIVEITNTSFELTGAYLPGRPKDERLVLRKTTRSKQILGDMGEEAATTLEAWPFPNDLKQKPIYSLTVSGTGGQTQDGTLYVVSRGLEETDWWSVYKLGTGQHLFDTYVPLAKFSLSRENYVPRYAGVEIPPDDTTDARLKDPHVVAVLSYASAERVIRETVLTCDDPKQAAILRALEDETRVLSVVEPGRALRLAFSQNFPSPPATVTVQIPIAADDLDIAHAQLPPKLHLAGWKR